MGARIKTIFLGIIISVLYMWTIISIVITGANVIITAPHCEVEVSCSSWREMSLWNEPASDLWGREMNYY